MGGGIGCKQANGYFIVKSRSVIFMTSPFVEGVVCMHIPVYLWNFFSSDHVADKLGILLILLHMHNGFYYSSCPGVKYIYDENIYIVFVYNFLLLFTLNYINVKPVYVSTSNPSYCFCILYIYVCLNIVKYR